MVLLQLLMNGLTFINLLVSFYKISRDWTRPFGGDFENLKSLQQPDCDRFTSLSAKLAQVA